MEIRLELMNRRTASKPRFESGVFYIEDIRERVGATDFKVRSVSESSIVSDELSSALLAARPTLVDHACSDHGEGLAGNSLVHALEHVAIDLLVERDREANPDSKTTFAGYTVWMDRASNLSRLTISSDDNAACIESVCDACKLISEIAASLGVK